VQQELLLETDDREELLEDMFSVLASFISSCSPRLNISSYSSGVTLKGP